MKVRAQIHSDQSGAGREMKTLKALSALLCYPQPEMHATLAEMAEVIAQEGVLPDRQQPERVAGIELPLALTKAGAFERR